MKALAALYIACRPTQTEGEVAGTYLQDIYTGRLVSPVFQGVAELAKWAAANNWRVASFDAKRAAEIKLGKTWPAGLYETDADDLVKALMAARHFIVHGSFQAGWDVTRIDDVLHTLNRFRAEVY